MRSSVPDSTLSPAPTYMKFDAVGDITLDSTHVLLPSKVNIAVPESASPREAPFVIRYPVVEVIDADKVPTYPALEAYPVDSIEPAPTRIITELVPFVLTARKATVMRLTQEGMPVKSIAVPDVLATAVPDVSPAFKKVGVPSAANVTASTCAPAVAPVLILNVPSFPLSIDKPLVLVPAEIVVVAMFVFLYSTTSRALAPNVSAALRVRGPTTEAPESAGIS